VGRPRREQQKAFASSICSQTGQTTKKGQDKDMPKYVIERDVLGIGNATDQEVQTISQKSSSVLNAPALDKPNIFRGLRVHLN